MSQMLDPQMFFRLEQAGVTRGWQCLEVGAGNGSVSHWLAERVGPEGHVAEIRLAEVRLDVVLHRQAPEVPDGLVLDTIPPKHQRPDGVDELARQSPGLGVVHRGHAVRQRPAVAALYSAVHILTSPR